MSAEALAIALNHSRSSGTAKVVMIGIANHDGDGGSWPSVATLARYANVTSRNVQKALDVLERLGEIRRMVQKGGTHLTADDRRPNLYQVLLRCPPDCDGTTQHRTRRQQERQQVLPTLGAPDFDGVSDSTPRLSTGVSDSTPHPLSHSTPEPVLRTRAKEPRTKSSDRARTFVPMFADERCPGNWKDGTHALAVTGLCTWCHERPAMVDPSTGDVQ